MTTHFVQRSPKLLAAAMLAAGAVSSVALAGNVTGNPIADGWTHAGYSLSEGSYVRSTKTSTLYAAYGFDMYRAAFNVTSGSNLEAAGWAAGDLVLGVGGSFRYATAEECGWSQFSDSHAVNANLGSVKLQAKFGTADNTWAASSTGPGPGDGVGSLDFGGVGAVQIRTSAYNDATFWASNSGAVMNLQSSSHFTRQGGSHGANASVARLVWEFDSQTGLPSSWQILLNVTQLQNMTTGGFSGLIPDENFAAILTVQNADNGYTDGLIHGIPAPGALALLGLAGVVAGRRRR